MGQLAWDQCSEHVTSFRVQLSSKTESMKPARPGNADEAWPALHSIVENVFHSVQRGVLVPASNAKIPSLAPRRPDALHTPGRTARRPELRHGCPGAHGSSRLDMRRSWSRLVEAEAVGLRVPLHEAHEAVPLVLRADESTRSRPQRVRTQPLRGGRGGEVGRPRWQGREAGGKARMPGAERE